MSEAELECCESVEIHQDRLKIVSDQMPEEEELYDLAELFKVFGAHDAAGHLTSA